MERLMSVNDLLTLDKTLNTPHLPPGHALFQVLDPMFASRGAERKKEILPHLCWGAGRFGLEKTESFLSLTASQKDALLLRLTELNLSLSYFIEKSGHNYASKMILSSEASEEKTFYALIASEEATHLRMFMNSMWFTPTLESHFHPMLPVLSDAIRWGTHDALVFVVQVLLEGFGISHYTALKDSCLDPDLKASFQSILKDEARHHGAGLILSKAITLDSESEDQVFELSRKFIRSLETAHWVPEAFKAIGKSLSVHETNKLFEQMGFKTVLEQRMERLREMFLKVDYQNIFKRLEIDGAFMVASV
jgi:rubrerythrin